MTVNFKVMQNGRPCSYYIWDDRTRTFMTQENNLVIDFCNIHNVTFKTGSDCKITTGHGCTFKTGHTCEFDTGDSCTFIVGSSCTFKVGAKCVIVRRDVFEVIQPEPDTTIELNINAVTGYMVVPKTRTITIAGKDVEISEDSFQAFKKQFNP